MRDVIFSLLILGLVPVCYRRPFIGLLVFSWLAYMRTQDLTWGFARNQRWSFLIAVVTFAGWIFQTPGRLFPRDIRCYAMIGLVLIVGVGIAFSYLPTRGQFNRYLEYVKIVTIALFTAGIVVNRTRLRLLVWVIALSFGFYGVKIGMAGVLSFGSLVVRQGPGGMLEDNNDFSLALCMALPLLLHIGMSEKRPVLRRAMLAIVPLTALTVILTHSRGGFLSLATVVGVLAWRSRNRAAAFAAIACISIVGFFAVPQSFRDRIASIGDYESDGSAMGRLRAWKVAIRMAKANPVLGVGFEKFQQHYLEYCEVGASENVRVAHNSYLQIWAECGTPAFALYLFLIGASLWDLHRVRKLARQRYYTSWIINYATMFETSMASFIIGSVFLNRAHFDLFYHYVAIVLVFGRIAREEMQSEGQYPLVHAARTPLEPSAGVGFERRPVLRGFRSRPLVGGPQVGGAG